MATTLTPLSDANELLPDEEQGVRDRHWHPHAGEVIIDVGCCLGSYALPALAAGATVYAIDGREPPLLALRATARSAGIDGELTLIYQSLFDGGAYPSELVDAIRHSQYESSRDMVPQAPWSTLDRLIGEYEIPRVDWVKVDVEGGELGVLEGAAHTLRFHRPRWLVEDHSRVYPWVAQQGMAVRVKDLFAKHDYAVQSAATTYTDHLVATPQ